MATPASILIFVHAAIQAGGNLEFNVSLRASEPAHIYVDDDATGAKDGSSWCDAYVYLQDALDAARGSGGLITEIRVAQGVYKPDQGEGRTRGDRTATFELMSGVALLGGYAGCGAADPDDRDHELYISTLSGDLNGDDDPTARGDSDCCSSHETTGCDEMSCQGAVCEIDPRCCDRWWDEGCAVRAELVCCELCRPFRCENSYNVLTATATDATARLDGLAITGGEASAPYDPGAEPRFRRGGALYIYGASPTITNTMFHENAGSLGSALYTSSGGPTVRHCTFAENGWYAGGPAALENWRGELVITESRFISNRGKGLRTTGSEAIVNCSFVGNVSHGGYGAGLYLVDGAPNIIGCTFIGNMGYEGGGMYNGGYSQLVNCVFHGNSASYAGGGLFSMGTASILINCTFSGNTAGGYTPDPWSTPYTGHGGAVTQDLGGLLVLNSTFVGNSAGVGAAMATYSGPSIANSVFWANDAVDPGPKDWQQIFPGFVSPIEIDYSCVEGWTGRWGGEGNMGVDPLFVDADGADDVLGTEDDNLRLSVDSPLINAGDPDPPLVPYLDGDGHDRILCGRVDMGAYEFGIGDYDCNDLVELLDFAAWDACMTGPDNGPYDAGCEAFDFDASARGDIDLKDFAGFQRTLRGD